MTRRLVPRRTTRSADPPGAFKSPLQCTSHAVFSITGFIDEKKVQSKDSSGGSDTGAACAKHIPRVYLGQTRRQILLHFSFQRQEENTVFSAKTQSHLVQFSSLNKRLDLVITYGSH